MESEKRLPNCGHRDPLADLDFRVSGVCLVDGMILLLCIIQQAFCAMAAIYLIRGFARRRQLLDIPNERSLHNEAIPRLGGAAFGPIILVGATVWLTGRSQMSVDAGALLLAAAVIYALGMADDVINLPSGLRLAVQGAVAVGFLAAVDRHLPASGTMPQWAILTLLWFWLVGLTNAYNFMDGIDGIAGIQAVVAGAYWLLVAGGLQTSAGVIAACITGAAAGFLVFNWAPARIFMGDAGSTLLGFLFAALPLLALGQASGRSSPWLGLLGGMLAVWPFVLDTTVTFARRLGRGENVFQAHRSHLDQHLALRWGSHRLVALLYGGLAVLGALLAWLVVS